jgi:hypothetical protein
MRITLGALGAALLSIAATGVPAQAAPAETGRHCRVVLDELKPGESVSRVVSRTCADNAEDLNVNRASLLTTWYEHADYRGSSTVFEGRFGPCDAEGYGFRDTGSWGGRVSSYRLYNRCHNARLYTAANYGGSEIHRTGDQSGLPPGHNDNVRSLRLTS